MGTRLFLTLVDSRFPLSPLDDSPKRVHCFVDYLIIKEERESDHPKARKKFLLVIAQ